MLRNGKEIPITVFTNIQENKNITQVLSGIGYGYCSSIFFRVSSFPVSRLLCVPVRTYWYRYEFDQLDSAPACSLEFSHTVLYPRWDPLRFIFCMISSIVITTRLVVLLAQWLTPSELFFTYVSFHNSTGSYRLGDTT